MLGNLRARTAAVLTAIAALTTLTGCASAPPSGSTTGSIPTGPPASASAPHTTSPATSSTTKSSPRSGTALAALDTLPVKGRAPLTGYSRDQFGQEWSDAAGRSAFTRNGCDTRNDVLGRDLANQTFKPGTRNCVVLTGTLAYEPYTGDTNRPFVRGGSYDESFDIEHVVALGNAWVTGAQQLSADQRAALANDPIEVFTADPSANRQKGDADAATWLPANKAFRCSYVARQIRVKTVYHLWVTAPEKAAMQRVLATCPNEPLDQPDIETGHKVTGTTHQPTPPRTTSPPATAADSAASGGSVYYANCTAVRAAGAAPIHRGDPGYSTTLDRDGDGVACE